MPADERLGDRPTTPPERADPVGGKPATGTGPKSEIEMLGEIRDLLERQQRRAQQHDFSARRLVGSLLQMLAISAAVWGLVALLADRDAAAAARLGLAAFLQLATLTTFSLDRQR